MKLLEATQNGIGLSDIPDEWFELSESYFGDQIMWNNYQAIIGERMCLQHRYDEAAFLIDSIFDAKSPLWGMTESSLAVVRFHIAVLHGDLDKAKEIFEMHLEKNADMIKNDVSYARVKYGYKLITETDSSCIENEKKHFIAISDGMKMSAYAFMVSYELECCEEMEAAIKEALATRNT